MQFQHTPILQLLHQFYCLSHESSSAKGNKEKMCSLCYPEVKCFSVLSRDVILRLRLPLQVSPACHQQLILRNQHHRHSSFLSINRIRNQPYPFPDACCRIECCSRKYVYFRFVRLFFVCVLQVK